MKSFSGLTCEVTKTMMGVRLSSRPGLCVPLDDGFPTLAV